MGERLLAPLPQLCKGRQSLEGRGRKGLLDPLPIGEDLPVAGKFELGFQRILLTLGRDGEHAHHHTRTHRHLRRQQARGHQRIDQGVPAH